jgi:hypothetical protein
MQRLNDGDIMFGSVYVSAVEGLPFLVVMIENGIVIDVTPFERREDADAYLAICDIGIAGDYAKQNEKLNS